MGMMGNTLSFLVWDRVARKTNGSTSSIMYFKLLGVVNFCFLVSYILADCLQSFLPSLLHNYIFLSLYSYCFFPLFYYFNYATIWTMFSITIDRYLTCVRHVRLSCWTRRVLLIVMYIFGIVLNIPNVFAYQPIQIQTQNETIWTLHETQFSKNQANMDYKFWVHCFLICIVPLVIMTILNLSIVKSIRESFKRIEHHLTT